MAPKRNASDLPASCKALLLAAPGGKVTADSIQNLTKKDRINAFSSLNDVLKKNFPDQLDSFKTSSVGIKRQWLARSAFYQR